jgi:nucleoside-diphosphate-sugar epimerase
LEHTAVGRNETLPKGDLGDVIYCIGVTADFRTRPFDAVEAHVCKWLEVLRSCAFDSLLYLSSTRLYAGNGGEAKEEAPLTTTPLEPEHLYNISKLMGESAAFTSKQKVRVARLSNVYGNDFASGNFLPQLLKEALSENTVTIRAPAAAARDYIAVSDAVNGLIDIATRGRFNLYNVASGINVSNAAVAEKIASLTGARLEFQAHPSQSSAPVINIDRMRDEFGFKPACLLDDLEELVHSYGKNHKLWRA